MWLQHARVHRQAVHEPGLIEGTQPQVRLCQACGHQDGEPVGEPDGTVERCQLNLGFGHMFTGHINGPFRCDQRVHAPRRHSRSPGPASAVARGHYMGDDAVLVDQNLRAPPLAVGDVGQRKVCEDQSASVGDL